MTDKGAQMAPQSKAAAAPAAVETAPVADPSGPPDRSGEDFRREWADANGVDPSAMHEIHYPGGWVDRFDGRGWVQREVS